MKIQTFILILISCVSCVSLAKVKPSTADDHRVSLKNIIPRPVSVTETGSLFSLNSSTNIYVEPGTEEMIRIGRYLADKINTSTGYKIQVLTAQEIPISGSIYLTTVHKNPRDSQLGEEGYELIVTPERVTLTASQPEGLFRGLQTIRQILPPEIESSTIQTRAWIMATGTIRDYPRFTWRGSMLDVARHFFTVEEVKRYIDFLAYYKMNRFHLHLSDDQGWRIMIRSWPNLAIHGGSTAVGGGKGGYYTQAEYADVVAYAQNQYITLIPEIDMPGHTNAALSSYPELNCDGISTPLYTSDEVGFSSLCIGKDITDKFVKEVIGEIAALTSGPYFHIGGDEAAATKTEDYIKFIEKVQVVVQAQGKQMIGWEETALAPLFTTSIVQHWWNSGFAQKATKQGVHIIMSPASKAFMDIKYDAQTLLGSDWVGYTSVSDAYRWDPSNQIFGVSENDVLGLESPLWSETLQTLKDVEFMAFPRLLGYAELGWSPATGRDWDEYKFRLGTHGERLTTMGINFYRTPEVSWQ